MQAHTRFRLYVGSRGNYAHGYYTFASLARYLQHLIEKRTDSTPFGHIDQPNIPTCGWVEHGSALYDRHSGWVGRMVKFEWDTSKSTFIPEALFISDAKDAVLDKKTREELMRHLVIDPEFTEKVPGVILSIGEDRSTILTGFSTIMYNVIKDTGIMPKTFRINGEGLTLRDILKSKKVQSWLPKGAKLDIRGNIQASMLEETNPYGDYRRLRVNQAFFEQSPVELNEYRWVNVYGRHEWDHGQDCSMFTINHNFDQYPGLAPTNSCNTNLNFKNSETNRRSYIGMDEAPADGTILAIPLKHNTDGTLMKRSHRSNYLLHIQIRYDNNLPHRA